jgi:hypothetical protein
MYLGDKVESPWGWHLIPLVDANTHFDLAFVVGRTISVIWPIAS